MTEKVKFAQNLIFFVFSIICPFCRSFLYFIFQREQMITNELPQQQQQQQQQRDQPRSHTVKSGVAVVVKVAIARFKFVLQ